MARAKRTAIRAFRHLVLRAIGLAVGLTAVPAVAGPPFLIDDPEPTAPGHWEIYAPLLEAGGRGGEIEGAVAVELNYGALRDLQLTVALPVAFARQAGAWRHGSGDLELSAKYRFHHDEAAGLTLAVFPGITVPTASHGLGSPGVTALLPVWLQKDAGPWTVFGGGGYAINPGAGNRDYWTGGVAVTRAVGKRLELGVEVQREGATTRGASATTSLGVGATYALPAPLRVLASGGPTFEDGRSKPGYHTFMALGLDF